MKLSLLKLFRNLKFQIRWWIDKFLFLIKSPSLQTNTLYGYKDNLIAVDQLGSPNSSKVESYYGLINDVEAANRFGTDDMNEYSFWSWRSCGVANVVSILKTLNKFEGKVYDLVLELKNANGYLFEDAYGNKDLGWKHISLVQAFQKRGMESYLLRKVNTQRVLLELLKGCFVIASIQSRSNPGTSHMIVLRAFQITPYGIILNVFDPYTLDGQGVNKEISIKEFEKIFLNKGISVLINS